MAPIEPNATDQAETAIRDTIQALYNIMLHTSAYDAAGPQTSIDALVGEVHSLSQGLGDVSSAASSGALLPQLPPDLLQYVEDGRNPDIYTREFVELVRRTNQLRAGKSAAFSSFQDVLAGQIRTALPELSGDVDRVVSGTNGLAREGGTRGVAPAAASSAPAVSAASSQVNSSNNNNNNNSSNSNNATPGSEEHSVVDMLGMLPGTPQAAAAATGAESGAAAAAGSESAFAKPADQDAMQTT